MVVSWNGDTPKWIVYHGNSQSKMVDLGVPLFHLISSLLPPIISVPVLTWYQRPWASPQGFHRWTGGSPSYGCFMSMENHHKTMENHGKSQPKYWIPENPNKRSGWYVFVGSYKIILGNPYYRIHRTSSGTLVDGANPSITPFSGHIRPWIFTPVDVP